MSLSHPEHAKEQMITNSSSETHCDEMMTTARDQYSSGNLPEAKEYCLNILKQWPNNEEALHLLGIISFDENQFKESIGYLELAVQSNPESWKSHYALGCALSAVELYPESVLHFRKALIINPNEFSIQFELGLVLEKCEEFQAAINCYDHCLNLNPSHPGALKQAGIILFKSNLMETAENVLLKAIEVSADDPVLHYYYAEVLKSKGELQKAVDCLESILKNHPHSYETWFSLADIFISQEDYKEAAKFYENGLSINPNHAPARVNLGCIYQNQGNSEKAKSCFEKAISVDKSYVAAHFNLGNCYKNQEQYIEAQTCFEQVIELDPDHFEGFNNLGIVYHFQEKLDDSIQCYHKSIAISPEKSKAYSNLEFALFQQKKYDELIPICQQAIKYQPEQGAHYYYLGTSSLESNQTEQAILMLEKAVSLNSENADYYYSLGNTYKQNSENEKALNAYLKSLEINPDLLLARYNLANTYKNIGEFEQAIDSFKEILKSHPGHVPSLISMGNILRSMDRIEEAKENLESVQKHTGENLTLKLWITSLCPKVVNSTNEYKEHHQNGIESLKRLSLSPQQLSPDELLASGTPPSYFLQFHGMDTLPLKRAYANYYDGIIKRTHEIKLSDKPAVGIFLTDGHEGVFIRYLGRFLELFQTDDFEMVIICSNNCRKNIQERLRIDHLSFLTVSGKFSQVINTIAERGFDVLYHWEVGSDLLNYALPFYRLAPQQVTSVGLPETTGNPCMTHFLSSRIHEETSSSSHYSEELILGRSLLTVQDRMKVLEEKTKSDFGIPENKTIYFCAQKLHKFHPDMDSILGEFLRNDSNGLLVIPSDKLEYYTIKLRNRFERTIPDVCQRIHFVPRLTHNEYYSLVSQSDVILDTLHYGGGLSVLDFLSFNKPVITLPGEFLRGKVTAGTFRHIEIEEFIANSEEEYVSKAVRLGMNEEYRKHWERQISEKSNRIFGNQDAIEDYREIFNKLIEINRS